MHLIISNSEGICCCEPPHAHTEGRQHWEWTNNSGNNGNMFHILLYSCAPGIPINDCSHTYSTKQNSSVTELAWKGASAVGSLHKMRMQTKLPANIKSLPPQNLTQAYISKYKLRYSLTTSPGMIHQQLFTDLMKVLWCICIWPFSWSKCFFQNCLSGGIIIRWNL